MLLMGGLWAAALAVGASLGRWLARRGVTAETALRGRQGTGYLVLASATGVFALVYKAPKIVWLPTAITLGAEAAIWPGVQVLCAGTIGLVVALEWPGRRDRKRLASMIAAAALLTLALGFVAWRSMPVERSLRPAFVADGVVMQTSPYTCAPAVIATLVRQVLGDSSVGEREVVELAGTSRAGTTTLAEIAAMRRLGLAPSYARRLTPESLAARARPALLHVDEPVGATTIMHAVALLGIDSVARTVTLGNPLYGRQIKRWSALQGYWTGEAILVGVATRWPLVR
jgi:predicted double-glycine peptidase